jgi:hypothetical protein
MPDGRTLILGNVGTNQLEVLDLAALPFQIGARGCGNQPTAGADTLQRTSVTVR